MKKAVVFVTCALLNTPIFAQGLLNHVMRVKQNKVTKSPANPVDLTGHWVSNCAFGDEQDTITLDLKQQNDQLSFSMALESEPPELATHLDFAFETIKQNSSGKPRKLEHSMTYAHWLGNDHLYLEFSNHSFEADDAQDNYTFGVSFNAELIMTLEGEELTVDFPYSEDDISCVFNKQG